MAICVTGMHRSGTSMVMSVLHAIGLNVGDQADLIPANASNPDGHWEHVHFVDLDDALLSALGGGWDAPPAYASEDSLAVVRNLKARARRLQTELHFEEPWGWKDPRASLVLPFWLDVYRDLRVVVCLRNPLDVARSLRSRGHSSYAFGLALWRAYNERILAACSRGQRLVTHYEAYFERPAAELRRLATFVDLELTATLSDSVMARINPRHRHSASGIAELVEAGVPGDVIDLYHDLCEEADWHEPQVRGVTTVASEGPGVNSLLLELSAVRRQITALESVISDRDQSIAALTAARDQQQHAATVAHSDALAEWQGTIAERQDALRSAQEAMAIRQDTLNGQLGDLAAFAQQTAVRQRRALRALGRASRSHGREVVRALDELRTALADVAERVTRNERHIEYQRLVERVRRAVEEATPPGATVAVISKGDPALVEFRERHGVHFPQCADGRYLGYYPRDASEALRELQRVRRAGAGFLLVPATAFWWLDQYRAFAAHLNGHPPVMREDDTCVIFELTEGGGRGAQKRAES